MLKWVDTNFKIILSFSCDRKVLKDRHEVGVGEVFKMVQEKGVLI